MLVWLIPDRYGWFLAPEIRFEDEALESNESKLGKCDNISTSWEIPAELRNTKKGTTETSCFKELHRTQ